MRTNLHKESQEGCNDLGQSCRHPGGEEVLVMMLEHAIYLQRVVTSNDGCSVTPHSEPTLVVPWLENSKKCSSNSICVGVLQLSCDRFFADFLAKTTEFWMISTCHTKRNGGISVSCSIHASSKVTCCSKNVLTVNMICVQKLDQPWRIF